MFAATEASGEMVGHVRLEVNRHHRLGYIGRVAVAPDRRGRGLGTALMRALARHAFDELGLHRLSCRLHVQHRGHCLLSRGRLRGGGTGARLHARVRRVLGRVDAGAVGARLPSPIRLRRGRQDRRPARRRAARRAAHRARRSARSCPGGGSELREWSAEPAGTVLVAESEDGASLASPCSSSGVPSKARARSRASPR